MDLKQNTFQQSTFTNCSGKLNCMLVRIEACLSAVLGRSTACSMKYAICVVSSCEFVEQAS
jgi:hypothetical protein